MAEDWTPGRFAELFEKCLQTILARRSPNKAATGYFEIPLLQKNFSTKLVARYRKYKRLFTLRKIKRLFSPAPRNII
jgi:hypothetical protein